MKRERLLELAGVQLNEAVGILAAAFNEGDGKFIGIIGPFPSGRAARIFFKDIDGVRAEIEHPERPEVFYKKVKK
jgi:hypothetical protein